MNITSYNVTDVGYHYIGLRVLAALPSSARRDEQTETISRSIRKYVNDKALRCCPNREALLRPLEKKSVKNWCIYSSLNRGEALTESLRKGTRCWHF